MDRLINNNKLINRFNFIKIIALSSSSSYITSSIISTLQWYICIHLIITVTIIQSINTFDTSNQINDRNQLTSKSSSSSSIAFNDHQGNGPRFLVEPPSKVIFSNETGTVIKCKVIGTLPIRIWWTTSSPPAASMMATNDNDGHGHHQHQQSINDINGLRQIRSNGDLVLLPFSPQLFRHDVHSTLYRCMATNSVGTIRSRDCEVRAVIPQPYSLQVYGEYAIIGNTGHLKCQIPAFVRDYVHVVAWLKGDQLLATNLSPKDSKYIILDNGDLLIRNVTRLDSGYYRCKTQNTLTKETMISAVEGHFIVNDVMTGISPRISSSSQSPIKTRLGSSVQLLCVTKAWPQATVRWFQASESGLITPIHSSSNVQIYDSLIHIGHVTEQHSGNWICIANNSLGEERAYIELLVQRPLKVNMSPEYLIADLTSSATFVCNISEGHHHQSQLSSILWLKDGQPIMMNGNNGISNSNSISSSSSTSNNNLFNNNGEMNRIRLIEPHVLNIRSIEREDAGCYQCIVQSEDTIIQAIGELKLGDSPPVFIDTFPDGLIYEQGQSISLKCSASSTLLPQIRWFLDDQSITGYSPRRVTTGDYVKSSGHVVSFVNITNAKVIDGGQYRCEASNNAGIVQYSGRINVIGPATLRPNWTSRSSPSSASLSTSSSAKSTISNTITDYSTTVISGTTITLICPVIAYPIETLIWKHRSATLPNNHRQQIEPIINGIGGKLTIQNVHRDNDQGDYECIVKGSDSKPIRGTIKMIVRVAPLIDSQLISSTTIANQGMKVKLMCSILEGDPPLHIKWFKHNNNNNNNNDDNQSSSSTTTTSIIPVKTNHASSIIVQEEEDYSLLTFRSVSIKHVGNYTCTVWNDVKTVNRTTMLIVNVEPSWIQEPKNAHVILGNNIRIDCNGDGNPKPKLLWKKSTTTIQQQQSNNDDYSSMNSMNSMIIIDGDNDKSIKTSDNVEPDQQHPSEFHELLSTYRRQIFPNGSLWIQEADKSDAGFYMCQVSNGIGAGLSKVIQLTVQSPPYFATKFLSKSVSKSETALLECEVQGDPILHVHWYKDQLLIHSSLSSMINDGNNNKIQESTTSTLAPSLTSTISTLNYSQNNHSMMSILYDKRYTIKQDQISSSKLISFLQIENVDRQDSTIYTCIARNNFGIDNTSVQLIVQEVPDAPPGVEVIEISSRSIQLQWKSPYSGNSPLIRFHIKYRRQNCTYLNIDKRSNDEQHSSSLFWNEISTQTGSELRYTVKGLMPNCYYEFKISSENQIGRSEHSTNPIIAKTLEEVPGGPPIDVQVETTSSTSLKIKWRPPIRSLQYGRIRGYYIGYKVAGSDDPFQYKNVDAINDDASNQNPNQNNDQLVSYITNLRRKTMYVIILQAYNSVGPGPRSDEIKISTFDSQPPTSPLLEVVTTTYDSILLKWDSSFQQHQQQPEDDMEEKEYILYYREDHKSSPSSSSSSNDQQHWYQKRIYSKTNQFVLNKDNSQGRIRCGTRYHLYMTATNSLGTGEPSETVIARTKGDTPIAPSRADFIVANSTAAILSLKSWQTRGCSIQAFTIQYKPIQQKQWIPLVEYLEVRDYFYIYHLSPNRDYQLLVSAHCEPGTTRQEYTFHTPNDSDVVRLHGSIGLSASASPMDPYKIDLMHSNNANLRNFTVLLPVLISLMVLIVILATLFGCLRRQHVNHVVNSIDAHGTIRSDLCVEHLARYTSNNNGNTVKDTAAATTTMLINDSIRRDSLECYPMTEFCPSNGGETITPNGIIGIPTSCTNSCDSKSNLLMNGGNLNTNNNGNDIFATTPRHHFTTDQSNNIQQSYVNNDYNNNNGKFQTLSCKQMKKLLLQQQQSAKTSIVSNDHHNQPSSYYSSPQRKAIAFNTINTNQNHPKLNRSDHEYAEPIQSSIANNNNNNHCPAILCVNNAHNQANDHNKDSLLIIDTNNPTTINTSANTDVDNHTQSLLLSLQQLDNQHCHQDMISIKHQPHPPQSIIHEESSSSSSSGTSSASSSIVLPNAITNQPLISNSNPHSYLS